MPKYLSSSIHPVTGSDRLSICAREKIDRPRIGLWVQDWNWDSKAEADALIVWAKDVGVTDLFLLAYSYLTTPYTLLGYAASCSSHITALRYSGQYPMRYMGDCCEPLGIRVNAWFIMYSYSAWHSPTYSFLNAPLGAGYQDLTSYGGQMWKIFDATARASVVAALSDFADSNPKIGIHLDYIRSDGTSTVHTATDITNLVSEIRMAVPDRELSVCSVTSGYSERSGSGYINQQPRNWVDSGYVDMVDMMGYHYGFPSKGEQMGQIENKLKGGMLVGFSAESSWNRPNDVAARIQFYQSKGYRHYALFDYNGAGPWAGATYKAIAQAINIKNNLQTLYPDPFTSLVSITVNQGVSVVFNDGASHTVTWAQLGIPGASDTQIKTNAESVVGHSLKPFVFHYDGSLTVTVGDWSAV